jgi:hypothetical protein
MNLHGILIFIELFLNKKISFIAVTGKKKDNIQ